MHPQKFSCLILSSTKLSALYQKIFHLTRLIMAEEVTVIAHPKTNLLDSVLKSVVSCIVHNNN